MSVACLTFAGLATAEAIARSRGYGEVYPIATEVWVAQWFKLGHSPNERTVFLGTSRTKFGLILDEWEAATNERPLILAWPGSSPQPVLHELANRKNYSGTIICGVAPTFLFNSPDIPWTNWMNTNIQQKDILRVSLSFYLSKWGRGILRKHFRFLNEGAFSPVELLRRNLNLTDREGMLLPFLPPYFSYQNGELQSQFADGADKDDKIIQNMRNLFLSGMEIMRHYGATDMDKMINQAKEDIRQIKSRGGRVIFVRHPSTGKFLEFEKEHYPRKDFFDRLCKETDSFGIHCI